MGDKYKNKSGVYIEAHEDRRGTHHINIYDRDPRDSGHQTIHINVNRETGEGRITRTTDGKKESTDIKCYITTACMRYLQKDFDDNCYELEMLRWLRDNCVSLQDVAEYYEIAPIIVEAINNDKNANIIYNKIYSDVIKCCVEKMEMGDYGAAYDIYKSSFVRLEIIFAKPILQNKLVKVLKKINLY